MLFQFKDGLYEDSPMIGQSKYCKINNTTWLTTTSNKLQIQVKILPQEVSTVSNFYNN